MSGGKKKKNSVNGSRQTTMNSLKRIAPSPRKGLRFMFLYKEPRSPGVWGAQAASLSFSAACRKAHRTFITRDFCTALEVVGKLSTTTGWQPVLPGKLHARAFMINSRGAVTNLMRLFAVPQRALLKARQKRLRAKDPFRESRDD